MADAAVSAGARAKRESGERITPPARRRPPPPESTRLMMTAFMAFIKGAVISAIVIAPFLGLWVAAGMALAFTGFCVWLAYLKGPGTGAEARWKRAGDSKQEV